MANSALPGQKKIKSNDPPQTKQTNEQILKTKYIKQEKATVSVLQTKTKEK